MHFEHVLVLVDFSEGSDGALRRAIQICDAKHARLTVLHAIGPPGTVPEDVRERIAAAADDELDARCARASDAGVDATAWLHPGSPVEALEEGDVTLAPDLVVVGARGHSALHRIWLGSVAEAVVRQARGPVLVVRGGGADAPYNRVLWASDGSPDSAEALRVADAIADAAAQRDVVHVADELVEPEVLRGRLAIDPLRKEARERLEAVAAAEHATPHFAEGPAAVEICRLAERLESDLIAIGAVGTRADAWLQPGSVTTRVLRRSACSVLVGRDRTAHPELLAAARDAHGVLGDVAELGKEEAHELRESIREVTRMARDARALEDEMLQLLAQELRERVELLEADHPLVAEALSGVVRQLARLGI